MNKSVLLALAAGALVTSTAGASSPTYPGHELAGKAKVSMDRARAIALRARPGKIIAEELEKEGGGSGLRYSFDVMAKGKTFEVGVDALNGRVLENGAESAAKEAKEEISERHAVKKH